MSTSPMQLAANQANALLSTGPRTESGKDIVSTNALSHGLTSARIILPGESQAEFDTLRGSVIETYSPGTPIENELVEQITVNMWRLRRAINSEATITDRAIKQIMKKDASLSYTEAHAAIFSDKDASRELRLFLRYYGSIERGIAKATATLKVIQKARRDKEAWEAVARDYRARSQAENGFVSQPVQPPAKVVHRLPKQFFKRRPKPVRVGEDTPATQR